MELFDLTASSFKALSISWSDTDKSKKKDFNKTN